MWGLQLAPLTAELVASIVREEQPQIDLAPLRPERFEPPWRHSQATRTSQAVRV
jgi:glycine/D-amino acid oxidase-like deaminating enzyme